MTSHFQRSRHKYNEFIYLFFTNVNIFINWTWKAQPQAASVGKFQAFSSDRKWSIDGVTVRLSLARDVTILPSTNPTVPTSTMHVFYC